MGIKFAFSTIGCPQWSIEQVALRAKEMGFDAVELRTLSENASPSLACDPKLLEPARVAEIFKANEIEIACLATSHGLHHKDETAIYQAMWGIRENIKYAAALNCPYLRILGSEVHPDEMRLSVIARIAERVNLLASEAAEQGVQLVFENTSSFSGSKDWWTLFNHVEHPNLGLLWNVANAASIGEGPDVSIPNLNSRIKIAKVSDLCIGQATGFVPLGEGTVKIKEAIYRLLGQGFEGYVTVELDNLWLDGQVDADQYLPQSLATLKQWVQSVDELREKAQVKIDKLAAKNAPKPRLRAS